MAKIAAFCNASQPPSIPTAATVTYRTWSVLTSLFFILNLMAVPLKGYVGEALPWTIAPLPASYVLAANGDASDVDATFTHLFQPLARSDPSTQNALLQNDWVYVLRYTLAMPPDGITRNTVLHHFPGVAFYGHSFWRVAYAFVTQNASARASFPPVRQCQLGRMVGLPFATYCLWIEPDNATNSFRVQFGGTKWETPVYTWVKFLARLVLGGYIGHQLWTQYYRHYQPLVLNLKSIGLNDADASSMYTKYVIQIGDPTYLVLNNPVVAVLVILDMYLGMATMGFNSIRSSQMKDVWQFSLGCFYGSRAMWSSFLVLRCATSFVKRHRWEEWMEPVDPGVLSIVVVFYAGPIFYMFCDSFFVTFTQLLCTMLASDSASIDVFPRSWTLSPPKTAIELILVLVSMTMFIVVGFLPLVYSYGHKYWSRHRRRRVVVGMSHV
ncbi:Aste57867_4539 [Aphanomyces stellatus]|uniref:Aste57867_4539 protein n=1 Tax=Aphanomyces stellatus TaxID=120398 RepID=A0A485KGP8_9STRA|nr:hypothetical protein As57867_004526 [Aphanomyces stellatus]VFT81648.1 Aste57867_4539 [Aphanomyces stellatus]